MPDTIIPITAILPELRKLTCDDLPSHVSYRWLHLRAASGLLPEMRRYGPNGRFWGCEASDLRLLAARIGVALPSDTASPQFEAA